MSDLALVDALRLGNRAAEWRKIGRTYSYAQSLFSILASLGAYQNNGFVRLCYIVISMVALALAIYCRLDSLRRSRDLLRERDWMITCVGIQKGER